MNLLHIIAVILVLTTKLEARCKLGWRPATLYGCSKADWKLCNRSSNNDECVDWKFGIIQANDPPKHSGFTDGKHTCTVFEFTSCQGRSLVVNADGWNNFPARSIKCRCLKNKFFLFWAVAMMKLREESFNKSTKSTSTLRFSSSALALDLSRFGVRSNFSQRASLTREFMLNRKIFLLNNCELKGILQS